jgi:hypothetical protein
MYNLVEIFNTNDLRWLLYVDFLPENYDTEYLIPVLDVILFEYEELKGDKFYTNFYRKSDFITKDAAKLVLLRGCEPLFICGYKELALDLLIQMKIKADSLESVDLEMRRITQKLQIRAMKAEGKKRGNQSFGAMCAMIKSQLPNADPQNATVAEFVGYENIIKQRAA